MAAVKLRLQDLKVDVTFQKKKKFQRDNFTFSYCTADKKNLVFQCWGLFLNMKQRCFS